ncbi:MAG: hypothetical protein ACFWUM_11015 [Eubacteriales bacterium]|jgi:hypothetical protein
MIHVKKTIFHAKDVFFEVVFGKLDLVENEAGGKITIQSRNMCGKTK